jgi:hypothetical protein
MSSNEFDPTGDLESFLSDELGSPQATTTAPEEAPEVVRDAPPPPPPEPEPEPLAPAAPPGEQEEGEEPPPEEEGDPNVSWATKKYGDDATKWAKAAYEMERHISQLTQEKHASDELAAQWYEYAQQAEASSNAGTAMPLSAQEEMWVENAVANPLEAARQAAFNGRVPLFNGIIERVAQENPGLAAQIGAQVQVELQNYVALERQQVAPPSLEQSLQASFNRTGIDLQRDGQRMSEKISELGEYHPYVRAILNGSEQERDLAVQAVHDLTRATTFSSRQVERSKAVQREEELRREAMVVQTGGMQPPPAPRKETPFERSMEEEWRRSGAWPYESE